MRKLGISIYPDKSDLEEMKDYILRAEKAGFSRIFSNLLSTGERDKDEVIAEFKEINLFAKEHGFEIFLDVNPKVFKDLDIEQGDLSFFKDIGADGVRLDGGYGGNQEAMMTFNEQDLLVEVNMSNDTHYIDNIMDFHPNKYNLVACHNFYPHPYSGLTEEHFNSTTERFNKYGLRTAAFVGSQAKDSYGPWPVQDGLVTLESHRDLPVDVQIKDFIVRGNIDDIIISNCFPTDEEMEAISKVNTTLLNLEVEVIDNLPEVETSILFDELHFNRGDVSEYMIRSTMSRVKHLGHKFELLNAPDIIKRGDIVIESSEFGHYAGELNIALKDMKNTGKSSVVGRVVEEEIFLLDKIKPWQKFVLTAK